MMSLLLQFYKIFMFTLGATCGIFLASYVWNVSNNHNNNFSLLSKPHLHLVTDSKYYNQWLRSQGVSRVPSGRNTCSKKSILESDYLKQHVKITCVIFVNKLESAYRIYSSWLARCDNFYFFGPKSNNFIPIITATHSKYPWQRLCKSLEYLILNDRRNVHWIILVNDDRFVIPENLRYSLVLFNSSEPFYGGHIKSHRNVLFSPLNLGVVLNRATLELLLQTNSLPCYLQNVFDPDYFLGRQLSFHSIYPKSLLDENRCNRFHPVTFSQIFLSHIQNKGIENHDLEKNTLKDQDGLCYSITSISFSMPPLDNKKGKLELFYDYMLYQFEKTPVCYSEGQYLSQPAYSMQRWAKSITMYTNKNEDDVISMSDEQYYQIWNNISLEIPQTY
ncbi:C1GALT1-specific chaperone 1-like protein [Diaphorina citri]|jgi:hypothetical protein|uniref:C1GALT1-specific chaperone 1-like protein n=1 Tax=Diaphorina citri TaxID=121845 RepID=A0A1S3DTR5_DIACI|nr:C1GALT1-specific chaperone 1-like protein [Diaphorina citri]